jgi:cytoskeletal protein RodZ
MASEQPASKPMESARTSRLHLQRYRQKSGVSLEQISERTKISLRFLRAIEAEEFDALPGGIFATSYLRQYAAAIGFDETELLTNYVSVIQTGDATGEAHASKTSSRSLLDRWFRIPA